MLSLSRLVACDLSAFALLLFTAAACPAAMVTVAPTVNDLGSGTYQYSYSIANTGPEDAFLIDIAVPADFNAVTNLTTPSGFESQFDPILGLVSFLENTSDFTATPTAGFSFDSPDAPGASTFTASLVDANFNILTLSGATLAPVPEPASLYLLTCSALALSFLKWRKVGHPASSLATNPSMEMTHVSNS